MVDNLRKKKLDAKRIALKQPHEVAYIRSIANKIIKDKAVSFSSIKRLAKAWLKITSKRK